MEPKTFLHAGLHKIFEDIRNPPKPNQPTNMNKIIDFKSAGDAIRGKGFIVGSVDSNGIVSFSPNPVVHPTALAARAECSRLADATHDKAYIYTQLLGAEQVVSKPLHFSI